MTTVLMAYASRRGSTEEVAQAVAQALRAHGLTVDVTRAADIGDLDGYDAVVLGGALYMGRWHPDARRFLRRHRARLAMLPVAAFGMGPGTSKERELAGARRQVERSLARVPEVQPFSTVAFGGVVDPEKLRFPFNRIPASDARDWDAIRAWGESLAQTLTATPVPA